MTTKAEVVSDLEALWNEYVLLALNTLHQQSPESKNNSEAVTVKFKEKITAHNESG